MIREWIGEFVVLKFEILWVFLFKKMFIGLVVKFFDGRSSDNIVGISVKIMLCRFEKGKLELEETKTFILQNESYSRFLEAYATY